MASVLTFICTFAPWSHNGEKHTVFIFFLNSCGEKHEESIIIRNFTPSFNSFMNKVRITAIRQTVYEDLMAKYENPIEHTCDVREGQQWISIDGQQPEGMCPSAWYSMREFVESLARGEGNFYDGWMKNPMSAMISCNDGFRPFSFYIEVIE